MITLNMWVWESGTTQAIKQEIKKFQKKFPGIEVEVTLIPFESAWDDIITAIKEQKGPDILHIGTTWNGTLAHLGGLRDITQECYNTNIRGDVFIPVAWTNCRFPSSERISSLPWYIDIRPIYYRADIFSESGVTVNDLDNWESFKQTCGKLKGFKRRERTIEVLGVSGAKETLLLHNIAPWIWGAGGDFLTPDGKQAAFNNERSLNGIEFYISLISKGYIPLSALGVGTHDIAQNFFIRGAYIMCIPGALGSAPYIYPASSTYVPEISDNCRTSLFPGGTEGRFVFCGGSNLAITSFSEHPQEAWEFIKYLVSYESQNYYPKTFNHLPSLLESFDALFMEETPKWQTGLRDSWKYGRGFPNVAAWGAIESLLIEYFGKIFDRIQDGNYDLSLVKRDLDKAASESENLLLMME